MSNIAIIPARGGSKRIPRKNIRIFSGQPMIAWSIQAALKSRVFDRIIVSTDDAEIAAIARQSGAETPFIRPATLSDDHTGTTAVMAHAIQWLLGSDQHVQYACCIYATAPFIRPSDLATARQIIENGSWNYVFAATEYVFPIFRAFHVLGNGGCEMIYPEHRMTRSQDLPTAMHDAGQFYWGRPQAWLEDQSMFDQHSHAYILPSWQVQDVDTEDDWVRAEKLWEIMHGTD